MTIEKRDFDTKTIALMEKLDEISGMIGDGNYVEMANILKELHNIKTLKEQVIQTPEYRRIVSRTVNPRKESKTKAEKMESDDYVFCKGCDNWLAKSYIKNHKTTLLCGRVTTTKNITHVTKKKNTHIHKCGQILAPIYRKKSRPTDVRKLEFYLKETDQDGLLVSGAGYRPVDARHIFGETTEKDYRDYVDSYRLPDPLECEQCKSVENVAEYWWIEAKNEKWLLCDECGISEEQQKCGVEYVEHND
jgi:hypothetical protein